MYCNQKILINNYLKSGKVYSPKLTLYAFHLRHSLNLGPATTVPNADDIWHKFQQIGNKLNIQELQHLLEIIKNEYSQKSIVRGEILSSRFLEFTPIEDNNKLFLTGELMPLQIHDTYAVDLTYRYAQQNVPISQLQGLNPDNCLLPSNIDASLGQTLVLFAKPEDDFTEQRDGTVLNSKEQQQQAFADACVTTLISEIKVQELKVSCQYQGELLGSPFFEYNNDADCPKNQCHIIIWFNSDRRTEELEEKGDYYNHLIDLLSCRWKIIYSHNEAIKCNQKARQLYSELEKYKEQFKGCRYKSIETQLAEYSLWLKEIPEIAFMYADYVRNLESQRNTIATNSKNYSLYLKNLEKIILESDEIASWWFFLNLSENTYVEQINTELDYLITGQKFFDQMINTIRGIVEIEQAELDRTTQNLLRQKEETDKTRNDNLQKAIAILGFGLGAAQIGVSTAPYVIPQQQPPTPIQLPFTTSQPHPFVSSVLLSLIFGIAGAFVGWGLSSLLQAIATHKKN
ncbi:MAG: hypothetical protein HC903_17040 [Methylacidiphilales bacterium]|nr:hypothetical protein [Candidatus Methylacidiphilales bacterium]